MAMNQGLKEQGLKGKGQLTLGLDPEFILTDATGAVVPANSTMFNSTRPTAQIGCDAAGMPLEFRPLPSKNPHTLLSDVRKLMKQVVAAGYELHAGGVGNSIGCHIHFSGAVVTKRAAVTNVRNIVNCLDEWLGKPFYHLNDPTRINSRYGNLGQYETGKTHGGWEYRSLPAAVLAMPHVAVGVLRIAKYVVLNYKSDVVKNFRFTSFADWYTNIVIMLPGEDRQDKMYDAILADMHLLLEAPVSDRNHLCKNVCKWWKVGKIKKRTGIVIMFSNEDDWDVFPTSIVQKIKFYNGWRFFGLRADRGDNVIAISAELASQFGELIYKELGLTVTPIGTNSQALGLPRAWRSISNDRVTPAADVVGFMKKLALILGRRTT